MVTAEIRIMGDDFIHTELVSRDTSVEGDRMVDVMGNMYVYQDGHWMIDDICVAAKGGDFSIKKGVK